MPGKLIGFIYYTDSDYMSEYYGVAVEDGHVVEWSAASDWDGHGSMSANYQEMLAKYGAPTCFTDYDKEEDERCEIWDKFEQRKAKLLATAKREAGVLIGFICHGDFEFEGVSSEYYGVAVEDGQVVEWYAFNASDGTGGRSSNFNKMVQKYKVKPILFEGYDPLDYQWETYEKFDKACDELLATARKEAAAWTN